MKRLSVVLLLIVTVGSAVAQTDQSETGLRPVVTEIVETSTEELRNFPGFVAARVQTNLAFQTAGQIAERPVELGDRVEAGSVIATLDQTTLAEDVAAAEAALRSAQAQSDFAQQSYERAVTLNEADVVSTERLDAARADRDRAQAALQAARADLERARDAETFGTLVAPAAGVILQVHAQPGATVTAGTPIVTLAATDQLEVTIDVPSELLPLLEPGTRFRIGRRSFNTEETGGTLRVIEPVIEAGARSNRVHINIDREAALRLGTLVSVSMDSTSTPVISLPRSAVTSDGYVWRIGSERVVERVAVQVGAALGERVVIADGIEEGDEILVRGIGSVTSGESVGERIAP